MAETTNLMPIGQFSSLTRLSVRMLRHYDSHGVLVPAAIDPWTGFRRYARAQLAEAADIRNLRDLGFGVSAMGVMLAARGTPAWPQALQLQRDSLVAQLQEAQARVALVNRLLDEGEHHMSITITRTVVPAMTVVALRGTVPTYGEEHRLWDRLLPILKDRSIVPLGPCGVIEHDDQYTDCDVDLSIFLPVASDTSVTAPLEILDLPERDCLVALVRGSYDRISEAHDLINARLVAENLGLRRDGTLAGKAFNRYLTTPDQVSEADLVTEVCLPLG